MDKSVRRRTIVFVTDQFQCERIIKAGRAISNIAHTELAVCNVNRMGQQEDPAALQHLFNVSKDYGSAMNVVYAADVLAAMEEAIREGNTVSVITGEPHDESSLLYTLWQKFGYVNFFTVDPEGHLHQVEQTSVVHTAK